MEDIVRERGGLFKLSPEDVERIVRDTASKLGTSSEAVIMQEVMKRYRGGRIDARDVSAALKRFNSSS